MELLNLTNLFVAIAVVFAAIPFGLTLWNFIHYAKPKALPKDMADAESNPYAVSLLIPARNEAKSIETAIRSALASQHIDLEVLVLDDHSTDDTADIVKRLAAKDSRVRLLQAPDLPDGWCGKQHACYELSKHAKYGTLCWIDADVQLKPQALVRAVHFKKSSKAQLVSGFPHQQTGTWMEKLVVPQIMLVLMGYLPMMVMRRSASPGFAAGCGQFFMTNKEAYNEIGGHGAIRASLHDGVTLPRAFRTAGHRTDLFDATDLVSCRMYDNAKDVWQGFGKNATEGMAGSIAIWVWTILLFCGHILPWLLVAFLAAGSLGFGPLTEPTLAQQILIPLSSILAAGVSVALMIRFRQGPIVALLRPFGVVTMLGIQWHARLAAWRGKPLAWRGRTYVSPATPS